MTFPFFTVWNPTTGYTKYRHDDYDAAKQEAERLAGLHKGMEFYVLGAMARSIKKDIDTQEFVKRKLDAEIPF